MPKSENLSLLVAKAIWPEIDLETVKTRIALPNSEKADVPVFDEYGRIAGYKHVTLRTFVITLRIGYDPDSNTVAATEPELTKGEKDG